MNNEGVYPFIDYDHQVSKNWDYSEWFCAERDDDGGVIAVTGDEAGAWAVLDMPKVIALVREYQALKNASAMDAFDTLTAIEAVIARSMYVLEG